jgi:hypothetical protein
MATTRIWSIRGDVGHVLRYVQNTEKAEPSKQSDSLDSVLHYVGRGDKTDAQQFVSALNCAPDTARMEMMAVKHHFDKTRGIVAFHGYQSFAPGEVIPAEAHQIGMQLITELWGDRFQVVLATHLDKEHHIHNHFVLNSVSFVDGKKFHSDAKFLHRLQETSDRLCREHGLSVIQEPKQGATQHHGEYAAEKKGVPTWRSLIQSDIDQAIVASMTEQQFFRALQDMGYDYKLGQDISVRPPGKERYFRLKRNLGEEYSMDGIRRRLGRNLPVKPQPTTQPIPIRHYRLKGKFPRKQTSHLRRMYLYYCYRLGVFKKHPQSTAKMHFLLREDLRDLDKYTQEIRLLHTYRIDTDVQLSAFQAEQQQNLDSLIGQRNKLRNRLRRPPSEEAATRTRQEIAALSKEISTVRQEVKLCNDIHARSKSMAEKLQIIRHDERRKEELMHGHQRTGR